MAVEPRCSSTMIAECGFVLLNAICDPIKEPETRRLSAQMSPRTKRVQGADLLL
jgi:hypothetical protein